MGILHFASHMGMCWDGDLPGKFRLGDIRAERYNLHSHAEHGNEDKGMFSESPKLWIRPDEPCLFSGKKEGTGSCLR